MVPNILRSSSHQIQSLKDNFCINMTTENGLRNMYGQRTTHEANACSSMHHWAKWYVELNAALSFILTNDIPNTFKQAVFKGHLNVWRKVSLHDGCPFVTGSFTVQYFGLTLNK